MLLHWESALGWERQQLTGAFTLAMFVSAGTSPIIGRLIDQGQAPQVMSGCSLIGALCLLSLSFVSSLVPFLAIWALMGIVFAGCLYEPCFALVTRARGTNAKRMITRITLIAGFASSLSFPLVHWLVHTYDWMITLRIFAAITLLIATPLMWLGASRLERSVETLQKTMDAVADRSFLGSRKFWFLAIAFSALALAHGMTLHHLLPILHEKGFGADLAVLIASLIGPMQVLGRIIMMGLEGKASNQALAIGCFILMGLSILMLMFSTALPVLVFVFVALFGSAYGMVSILRPVIARDVVGGAQFGAKSGVLAMVYLFGAATAPWLASMIWTVGTYTLVLPCIMSLSIVGLWFYTLARRSNKPIKDVAAD